MNKAGVLFLLSLVMFSLALILLGDGNQQRVLECERRGGESLPSATVEFKCSR